MLSERIVSPLRPPIHKLSLAEASNRPGGPAVGELHTQLTARLVLATPVTAPTPLPLPSYLPHRSLLPFHLFTSVETRVQTQELLVEDLLHSRQLAEALSVVGGAKTHVPVLPY